MLPLAWQRLEQVFTVETLMTPRAKLLTWELGADMSEARAEAGRRRFDLLPLAEEGRIMGVLHIDAESPELLTKKWLVSRDTGIPDLLSLFAESGQPGFLVFHRQDVVGLVTPADLNKLPARAFFYNLIGELELSLAVLIRNHFNAQLEQDPDSLLQLLSGTRRAALQDERNALIQGNADIDLIELLYLSDMVNIVAKQSRLRDALGFSSRNQAEDTLGGLNALRNSTMHPVRPLLEDIPDDLLKLHRRVQRATDVLSKLQSANR